MRLQAGDRIRVGPVCDDILKRFGHTGDPLSDMAVAGLCRLALQATTDPENRRAVHALAPPPTDDFQRAVILAEFGHYDLVASGVTKHLEQTHDDEKYQYFYFVQCVSLVAMGDLQGYRSAADKVLSRSGNMSNHYLTFMALCCTLAPDAVTDLAVPVRMVEKAMTGPILINSKEFTLLVLGAALYRAGRFDEAIARARDERKTQWKGIPAHSRVVDLPRDGPPQERERRRGSPLARKGAIPQAGEAQEGLGGSEGPPPAQRGRRIAKPEISWATLRQPRGHAPPQGVGQAGRRRTQRVPIVLDGHRDPSRAGSRSGLLNAPPTINHLRLPWRSSFTLIPGDWIRDHVGCPIRRQSPCQRGERGKRRKDPRQRILL